MGDDFINNRNTTYKRQNEKVHAEEYKQLGISLLADEKTSYVFRFRSPGVELEIGEEICLADVPEKERVRVMQGAVMIGELDAAGSAKLRELFAEHECLGGFVTASVTAKKDISGYAKAKLAL